MKSIGHLVQQKTHSLQSLICVNGSLCRNHVLGENMKIFPFKEIIYQYKLYPRFLVVQGQSAATNKIKWSLPWCVTQDKATLKENNGTFQSFSKYQLEIRIEKQLQKD